MVHKQKLDTFKLWQSIKFITNQKNYDFKDLIKIPMILINSVYQLCQVNYAENEHYQFVRSENNQINKNNPNMTLSSVLSKSRQQIRRGSRLLDQEQKIIYDIFNTESSIHFQLYKEEIKLHYLKIHPYLIRIGPQGLYYRDDKFVYEVMIKDKYKPPDMLLQRLLQRKFSLESDFLKIYRFSFLNVIHKFDLQEIETPPYQQKIPPSIQRMLNIYYILREMILEGLDYLHTKQCASGSLYNTLVGPKSQYSDSATIPSLQFRKSKQVQIQQDLKAKTLERNIKQQATKLKRQHKPIIKDPLQDPKLFFTVDQARNLKIQFIPNDDQQPIQFKLMQKEINVNIPAGDKTEFTYLPQVSNGAAILKRKGKSLEYGENWLELRGFYILWYKSRKDKLAKGIAILDEVPLKDEGLIQGERIYHVSAGKRFSFQINRSLVGAVWRKILSNQVAYKTYLNNLMFNIRIAENYNAQQTKKQTNDFIDEAAQIKPSFQDYFMFEDIPTLDLSNDVLNLELVNNWLKSVPKKLISYNENFSQIIADSLLSHSNLQYINLYNSQCGPILLTQLFRSLQDKRLTFHIFKLDVSKNQFLMETMVSLTNFLKTENSFSLTHLYLDDVKLGDSQLDAFSEALNLRYQRYWEQSELNMNMSEVWKKDPLLNDPNRVMYLSRRKTQHSQKKNEALKLLKVISIRNTGVSDKGLFNFITSIEQFISKVIDVLQSFSKENQNLKGDLSYNHIVALITHLSTQQDMVSLKVLNLLQDLYGGKSKLEEEIFRRIRMDIMIGGNDAGDSTLFELGNVIEKYDCFRLLNLSHMKITQATGFDHFLNSLSESVNLEVLDLKKIKLTPSNIFNVLNVMCENVSIQELHLTYQENDKFKFSELITESTIPFVYQKHLNVTLLNE